MSAAVRAEMKDAYPELKEHAARITKILDEEEHRFMRTVEVGLRRLEEEMQELQGITRKGIDVSQFHAVQQIKDTGLGNLIYPGEKAFRLYDTFGLPRDFIEDVLRDNGLDVRLAWLRSCDGRTAHARKSFLEGRT